MYVQFDSFHFDDFVLSLCKNLPRDVSCGVLPSITEPSRASRHSVTTVTADKVIQPLYHLPVYVVKYDDVALFVKNFWISSLHRCAVVLVSMKSWILQAACITVIFTSGAAKNIMFGPKNCIGWRSCMPICSINTIGGIPPWAERAHRVLIIVDQHDRHSAEKAAKSKKNMEDKGHTCQYLV